MTKISELGAAAGLTGTEVLPVVQSGETKKAEVNQLFAFVDTLADAAANSATAAAQSAAYAGGFEVPEYASQAAGEAALTTVGLVFRVPKGTTPETFDWYRIDAPGSSELVSPLATSAALAAPSGAVLVGSDDGASGTLWTTIAGFIAHLRSSVGSAIVGFLQAGTGATARTAQDKLRDVVSSEDYATLEQAIAFASANDLELRLKDGEEYTLSSNVTLTAGLRMRGNAKIRMLANTNGIVIEPARTVSTSVSAISVVRFPSGTGIEQTTALTVASSTGLAVNDVCLLYSSDTYSFNANVRRAELVKINGIAGTTVNLAGRLIESYTTGVTLVKLNAAVVDIDGPEFVFDGDPLGVASKSRSAAITLLGCVAPRVRATFHDDIADGVRLFSCWMPDVDVRAYNLRDNNGLGMLGYGVAVYSATTRGKIRVLADKVRHAYTDGVWETASDAIRFGRVSDCVVYDSIATNATAASFDTHPGARNIRFVNCGAVYNTTDSGQPSSGSAYAFQDRAVNTKFIDCWSRGSRVPFFFGSVLQSHGEANTTEIIGGYFEREGTTSSTVFCGLPTQTTADICRVNIRGAVLDGFTPNQSAQVSAILRWHNVEFISDGTYGYSAVNNTGGMQFFDCTFREFSIMRLGQSNNFDFYGCRRINSGSNIEPIIPGVGSTCTFHDYYAEAASYGFSQVIRCGQASDAGVVTLNLGNITAKGFAAATSIGTNGTATVTINNMIQTQRRARTGATAARPTLNAADVGYLYLDTTLDSDGKPIWWTGTAWVDATGAVV